MDVWQNRKQAMAVLKITTNIRSQFEIMAEFAMILAHQIPTPLIITP